MELWRKEVGRELSSLRGHINRATSLGNLEERCIWGWSCRLLMGLAQDSYENILFWCLSQLEKKTHSHLVFFLSFSSKLRREELEHLRRELDQLKTQLSESYTSDIVCAGLHMPVLACIRSASMILFQTISFVFSPLTGRQEEDIFLQQTEARETRRQYERSCKVYTHIELLWLCLLMDLYRFRFLTFLLWALFRTWRS